MTNRNQNLNQLKNEIFVNAKKKGFYDDEPVVDKPKRLLLIISEAVEAMEADRDGVYMKELPPEPSFGFNAEEWKLWFDENIKNTYQDELADILIRTLDHFAAIGADPDFHVTRKMQRNSLRPYKHGKNY